jgi:rRNA maturation endonuclease Nob1
MENEKMKREYPTRCIECGKEIEKNQVFCLTCDLDIDYDVKDDDEEEMEDD